MAMIIGFHWNGDSDGDGDDDGDDNDVASLFRPVSQ